MEFLESESTLVTSPDFLSTPTMDQGRGLGKGLGFGPAKCGGVVSSVLGIVLGLASGEGVAFFSKLVNFEDLSPTMDPLGSSFLLSSGSLGVEVVIGVANSLVGEVKLAAKPVDLQSVSI